MKNVRKMKSKRFLEWGISFWTGVGLMSVINVWKIINGKNPIIYSWIMFFVSIILIVVGIIFLNLKRKN
jgi:uncharacterized membrane protein YidH (DUF202 family)